MKRPAIKTAHGTPLTGGHFAAVIVVIGMITLGTASWMQGVVV